MIDARESVDESPRARAAKNIPICLRPPFDLDRIFAHNSSPMLSITKIYPFVQSVGPDIDNDPAHNDLATRPHLITHFASKGMFS